MSDLIDQTLSQSSVIVIVGLSGNKKRDSYGVAKYLMGQGYTIIPVNPVYDEILGKRSYPTVASIPADVPIDVVNIFRDSSHTREVVEDVLNWMEKSDRTPVIWTQYSVSSEDAESLAEEHELPYIKNECMKVEHKRWNRQEA
ncbi:MAG: CoA-binding protein [Bacteroidota bacterium]